MTRISYKGFRILSRPYLLTASRRWCVELELHRNGQREAFSLSDRCRTEREADARCVAVGRSIIDGRVTGSTGKRLGRITAPSRRYLTLAAVTLALGVLALRVQPEALAASPAGRAVAVARAITWATIEQLHELLRRTQP